MSALPSYTPRCMSFDPTERLAALRREVAAESASVPPPTPATTPESGLPAIAVSASPASSPTPSSSDEPPPAVDRTASETPDGTGWDLQELLADTSLSTWLGIGLLAVGGYLVLSWFVPGIDLIGSLLILAAGVVLLAQHLQRGAGAWALYAGAVLTGMGAGRVLGDVLPGSPHGLTAVGVGCAFLAISYLRHTQAGGYGWQGIVGSAALGLGLIQLLLGLLPGSPGVIDLILPALLLIGGGMLIVRTRRSTART